MVMEGGYPKQIFVERIEDDLLCRLCNRVLCRAMSTPCGHVFCKSCVERWVAEHGLCPLRCAELTTQNLAWAGHLDTVVSGLTARCKYVVFGCKVQLPLREKAAHEANCPCGGKRVETNQQSSTENVLDVDWEEEDNTEEESGKGQSLGLFQRATKIVLSFRSRNARRKSVTDIKAAPGEEISPITGNMLSQRTFRLKRNRPREPLGLVLLSGDKTSDGRHKSYYVKKVNRDTLGWRAGILPGDRIIKVDNHDLHRMTPQESVSRIKEKSLLTLTVLREVGGNRKGGNPPHIYDEIDLFDQGNQLSQHALSQPLPSRSIYTDDLPPAVLSQFDENYLPVQPTRKQSPLTQQKRQLKTSADEQPGQKLQKVRSASPGAHVANRTASSYALGERTSKDSGLSSGSSEAANMPGRQTESRTTRLTPLSPPSGGDNDLNRDIKPRKSYRTEQEMVRAFIKEKKRGNMAPQSLGAAFNQPRRGKNYHIAGDYEFEDIHLEKNGTNQLGITLGYDSTAPHGSSLYVCEVVAGGLAAQDGRLQTGDIIQRVSGFRVFDPEEAILLFLEQDQDITLSVARKIKVPSNPRHRPEPDLDYLESKLLREGVTIRKVDSCGSLDLHNHHFYATLEPPPTLEPPSETGSMEDTSVSIHDRRKVSPELKLMATSQENITDSTTSNGRMRLAAMSRDSIDYFSTSAARARTGDENTYGVRRGSSPSRHSPFAAGGMRPITASSPNLLRVQHSPPSLQHQPAKSGSNLHHLTGRHHRPMNDRPSSTSPDSKFWIKTKCDNSRPIGGYISQSKFSSSNPLDMTVGSPTSREPRVTTPLSPTHPTPGSHGNSRDARRLPHHFDQHLQPSAAGGAEGRRESLV